MTKRTRKPTLHDVAMKANVSVATASRALNDLPQVDRGTRHAVRSAAEHLGYPLERLRRRRSGSRGVTLVSRFSISLDLHPTDGLSHFEQLTAKGVVTELRAHQVPITILYASPDGPRADTVSSGNGVIVLGGTVSRSLIEGFLERGQPLVMVGSHAAPLDVNYVMADYQEGMQRAVDHLVEQGCQRIGLINGPATTNTSNEKLRGFQVALLRHGLGFDPNQVVSGYFDSEAGFNQTHALLEQWPEPDGLIYAHNQGAVGGLSALKQAGLRIPQDVCVIGFHDYDINRFTDPPLSTIMFDMVRLGRIAARRLLMLLDDHDREPWRITIATALEVRGSSSRVGALPPPSGNGLS
jgi:DNA-binding LacI/PurR family transcriptional regulator